MSETRNPVNHTEEEPERSARGENIPNHRWPGGGQVKLPSKM